MLCDFDVHFLSLFPSHLPVRKKAADSFNMFDKDGSGSLHAADYDNFHKELVSQKLTSKSKDKFLEDLDMNNDGKIQYNEYVQWLKREGSIKICLPGLK